MTNKELYDLLTGDGFCTIELDGDDNRKYEMEQIGLLPMHGVTYAIMNILKVDDTPVDKNDAGVVLFELDFDDETEEYFVATVEEDDVFEEVMTEFEKIPPTD
ncbi:MAG TPA: DUF1292 domain-containing protein [Bacillota bacterium]|nr:DUF1292 domain-containing protein [Bacillota bacterium]HPF42276.1 DUF1292 domain-containing protein [Bacillota bacterium]HPJ86110.1 DUF1292 domain-containing protein [Bacillota bacterium]HPQ61957.1 DUF1292 domain-containing protein [Bacillota bacterium]